MYAYLPNTSIRNLCPLVLLPVDISSVTVACQVILVGHSAGGLGVTHAMHLFRDKIKQAIFIAATMLPFGYQTEQDIKDVIHQNFPYAYCFVQLLFIFGYRKSHCAYSLKLGLNETNRG